jgi:hypothetical protein
VKTLDTVSGISGVWPDATAIDDPVQGVGTNLESSWLADLFGFMQACLYGAGDTAPSGNAETKTVSQILAAIRAHCGNAGEIVAWSSTTIPTGVRLLKCEGALVTIASVPELVANVYCGDPANPTAPCWYKCTGVGVRDTSGTHFRLPDLRGYFLRGTDSAGTRDPEVGRLPGAVQAESIGGHIHDGIVDSTIMTPLKVASGGGANATIAETATAGAATYKTTATGTGIGTGTANETRPDNAAVVWCVRY